MRFTMNSVLQKAFLCCVLPTLLLKITSAKPLNTDHLRRLQGRVWRDVHSESEVHESDSTAPPSQQNNGRTDSFVIPHRSLRVKRTEPAYSVKRMERAGCNLATCSVHDLAHLLNTMRGKTNSAPPDKISSKGYGRRRRRSLPPHPALTLNAVHLQWAWLRTLKRRTIQKGT